MLYKQIGLVCVLLFNKTVQYKTARHNFHTETEVSSQVSMPTDRGQQSHTGIIAAVNVEGEEKAEIRAGK